MRSKLKLPIRIISVVAAAIFLVSQWPGAEFNKDVEESVRPFTICRNNTQQHCVVDGDTIRYAGDIIRLEDIDTPEIMGARCESERALGERAKRRLLELVNSAPIRAVHDGGREEDQYGRKLRIVEIDERSVGDTLIAEGLARSWRGTRLSWCG